MQHETVLEIRDSRLSQAPDQEMAAHMRLVVKKL